MSPAGAASVAIGVSLPWAYLCGRLEEEDSQVLSAAFGLPEACLEALRAYGVEAVELRYFDRSMRAAEIRRAVRLLCDARMAISVHGSLEEGREELFCAFPWAPEVLERGRQAGLVCTVHPLEGAAEGTGTVRLLGTLARQADRRAPGFRLALELMRARPRQSLAVTYGELRRMVARVNHPAVGICWDLGHASSSLKRGFLSAEVPEAFLERVMHTHIHGLGPQGETHWPLDGRDAALERMIAVLARRGYSGIYNLELSPERFLRAGEPGRLILASVQRLRACLEGYGPARTTSSQS